MRITQKLYQLKTSKPSNLLIINTCLGGVEKGRFFRVKLLVDTGATFTMVQPEIIKYLGYDLNNPIKYENITGLEGKLIQLPVIKTSWFNCAGKSLNNFSILAEADLIPIFGSKSILLDIINSQQKLSVEQIEKLSDFFAISPAAFFPKSAK
jgi:hypothetical protein